MWFLKIVFAITVAQLCIIYAEVQLPSRDAKNPYNTDTVLTRNANSKCPGHIETKTIYIYVPVENRNHYESLDWNEDGSVLNQCLSRCVKGSETEEERITEHLSSPVEELIIKIVVLIENLTKIPIEKPNTKTNFGIEEKNIIAIQNDLKFIIRLLIQMTTTDTSDDEAQIIVNKLETIIVELQQGYSDVSNPILRKKMSDWVDLLQRAASNLKTFTDFGSQNSINLKIILSLIENISKKPTKLPPSLANIGSELVKLLGNTASTVVANTLTAVIDKLKKLPPNSYSSAALKPIVEAIQSIIEEFEKTKAKATDPVLHLHITDLVTTLKKAMADLSTVVNMESQFDELLKEILSLIESISKKPIRLNPSLQSIGSELAKLLGNTASTVVVDTLTKVIDKLKELPPNSSSSEILKPIVEAIQSIIDEVEKKKPRATDPVLHLHITDLVTTLRKVSIDLCPVCIVEIQFDELLKEILSLIESISKKPIRLDTSLQSIGSELAKLLGNTASTVVANTLTEVIDKLKELPPNSSSSETLKPIVEAIQSIIDEVEKTKPKATDPVVHLHITDLVTTLRKVSIDLCPVCIVEIQFDELLKEILSLIESISKKPIRLDTSLQSIGSELAKLLGNTASTVVANTLTEVIDKLKELPPNSSSSETLKPIVEAIQSIIDEVEKTKPKATDPVVHMHITDLVTTLRKVSIDLSPVCFVEIQFDELLNEILSLIESISKKPIRLNPSLQSIGSELAKLLGNTASTVVANTLTEVIDKLKELPPNSSSSETLKPIVEAIQSIIDEVEKTKPKATDSVVHLHITDLVTTLRKVSIDLSPAGYVETQFDELLKEILSLIESISKKPIRLNPSLQSIGSELAKLLGNTASTVVANTLTEVIDKLKELPPNSSSSEILKPIVEAIQSIIDEVEKTKPKATDPVVHLHITDLVTTLRKVSIDLSPAGYVETQFDELLKEILSLIESISKKPIRLNPSLQSIGSELAKLLGNTASTVVANTLTEVIDKLKELPPNSSSSETLKPIVEAIQSIIDEVEKTKPKATDPVVHLHITDLVTTLKKAMTNLSPAGYIETQFDELLKEILSLIESISKKPIRLNPSLQSIGSELAKLLGNTASTVVANTLTEVIDKLKELPPNSSSSETLKPIVEAIQSIIDEVEKKKPKATDPVVHLHITDLVTTLRKVSIDLSPADYVETQFDELLKEIFSLIESISKKPIRLNPSLQSIGSELAKLLGNTASTVVANTLTEVIDKLKELPPNSSSSETLKPIVEAIQSIIDEVEKTKPKVTDPVVHLHITDLVTTLKKAMTNLSPAGYIETQFDELLKEILSLIESISKKPIRLNPSLQSIGSELAKLLGNTASTVIANTLTEVIDKLKELPPNSSSSETLKPIVEAIQSIIDEVEKTKPKATDPVVHLHITDLVTTLRKVSIDLSPAGYVETQFDELLKEILSLIESISKKQIRLNPSLQSIGSELAKLLGNTASTVVANTLTEVIDKLKELPPNSSSSETLKPIVEAIQSIIDEVEKTKPKATDPVVHLHITDLVTTLKKAMTNLSPAGYIETQFDELLKEILSLIESISKKPIRLNPSLQSIGSELAKLLGNTASTVVTNTLTEVIDKLKELPPNSSSSEILKPIVEAIQSIIDEVEKKKPRAKYPVVHLYITDLVTTLRKVSIDLCPVCFVGIQFDELLNEILSLIESISKKPIRLDPSLQSIGSELAKLLGNSASTVVANTLTEVIDKLKELPPNSSSSETLKPIVEAIQSIIDEVEKTKPKATDPVLYLHITDLVTTLKKAVTDLCPFVNVECQFDKLLKEIFSLIESISKKPMRLNTSLHNIGSELTKLLGNTASTVVVNTLTEVIDKLEELPHNSSPSEIWKPIVEAIQSIIDEVEKTKPKATDPVLHLHITDLVTTLKTAMTDLCPVVNVECQFDELLKEIFSLIESISKKPIRLNPSLHNIGSELTKLLGNTASTVVANTLTEVIDKLKELPPNSSSSEILKPIVEAIQSIIDEVEKTKPKATDPVLHLHITDLVTTLKTAMTDLSPVVNVECQFDELLKEIFSLIESISKKPIRLNPTLHNIGSELTKLLGNTASTVVANTLTEVIDKLKVLRLNSSSSEILKPVVEAIQSIIDEVEKTKPKATDPVLHLHITDLVTTLKKAMTNLSPAGYIETQFDELLKEILSLIESISKKPIRLNPSLQSIGSELAKLLGNTASTVVTNTLTEVIDKLKELPPNSSSSEILKPIVEAIQSIIDEVEKKKPRAKYSVVHLHITDLVTTLRKVSIDLCPVCFVEIQFDELLNEILSLIESISKKPIRLDPSLQSIGSELAKLLGNTASTVVANTLTEVIDKLKERPPNSSSSETLQPIVEAIQSIIDEVEKTKPKATDPVLHLHITDLVTTLKKAVTDLCPFVNVECQFDELLKEIFSLIESISKKPMRLNTSLHNIGSELTKLLGNTASTVVVNTLTEVIDKLEELPHNSSPSEIWKPIVEAIQSIIDEVEKTKPKATDPVLHLHITDLVTTLKTAMTDLCPVVNVECQFDELLKEIFSLIESISKKPIRLNPSLHNIGTELTKLLGNTASTVVANTLTEVIDKLKELPPNSSSSETLKPIVEAIQSIIDEVEKTKPKATDPVLHLHITDLVTTLKKAVTDLNPVVNVESQFDDLLKEIFSLIESISKKPIRLNPSLHNIGSELTKLLGNTASTVVANTLTEVIDKLKELPPNSSSSEILKPIVEAIQSIIDEVEKTKPKATDPVLHLHITDLVTTLKTAMTDLNTVVNVESQFDDLLKEIFSLIESISKKPIRLNPSLHNIGSELTKLLGNTASTVVANTLTEVIDKLKVLPPNSSSSEILKPVVEAIQSIIDEVEKTKPKATDPVLHLHITDLVTTLKTAMTDLNPVVNVESQFDDLLKEIFSLIESISKKPIRLNPSLHNIGSELTKLLGNTASTVVANTLTEVIDKLKVLPPNSSSSEILKPVVEAIQSIIDEVEKTKPKATDPVLHLHITDLVTTLKTAMTDLNPVVNVESQFDDLLKEIFSLIESISKKPIRLNPSLHNIGSELTKLLGNTASTVVANTLTEVIDKLKVLPPNSSSSEILKPVVEAIQSIIDEVEKTKPKATDPVLHLHITDLVTTLKKAVTDLNPVVNVESQFDELLKEILSLIESISKKPIRLNPSLHNIGSELTKLLGNTASTVVANTLTEVIYKLKELPPNSSSSEILKPIVVAIQSIIDEVEKTKPKATDPVLHLHITDLVTILKEAMTDLNPVVNVESQFDELLKEIFSLIESISKKPIRLNPSLHNIGSELTKLLGNTASTVVANTLTEVIYKLKELPPNSSSSEILKPIVVAIQSIIDEVEKTKPKATDPVLHLHITDLVTILKEAMTDLSPVVNVESQFDELLKEIFSLIESISKKPIRLNPSLHNIGSELTKLLGNTASTVVAKTLTEVIYKLQELPPNSSSSEIMKPIVDAIRAIIEEIEMAKLKNLDAIIKNHVTDLIATLRRALIALISIEVIEPTSPNDLGTQMDNAWNQLLVITGTITQLPITLPIELEGTGHIFVNLLGKRLCEMLIDKTQKLFAKFSYITDDKDIGALVAPTIHFLTSSISVLENTIKNIPISTVEKVINPLVNLLKDCLAHIFELYSDRFEVFISNARHRISTLELALLKMRGITRMLIDVNGIAIRDTIDFIINELKSFKNYSSPLAIGNSLQVLYPIEMEKIQVILVAIKKLRLSINANTLFKPFGAIIDSFIYDLEFAINRRTAHFAIVMRHLAKSLNIGYVLDLDFDIKLKYSIINDMSNEIPNYSIDKASEVRYAINATINEIINLSRNKPFGRKLKGLVEINANRQIFAVLKSISKEEFHCKDPDLDCSKDDAILKSFVSLGSVTQNSNIFKFIKKYYNILTGIEVEGSIDRILLTEKDSQVGPEKLKMKKINMFKYAEMFEDTACKIFSPNYI